MNAAKELPEHDPKLFYLFDVTRPDGQRTQILISEDGLMLPADNLESYDHRLDAVIQA